MSYKTLIIQIFIKFIKKEVTAFHLREKTFFIIFATFIILTIILYVISKNLLLGSFSSLEEEYALKQLDSITHDIKKEIYDMDKLVLYWASWDDTYYFIQNKNEDYVKKNLSDNFFIGQNVNIIIYVTSKHYIVYGKFFDLDKKQEIPVKKTFFEEFLKKNKHLLNHTSIYNTTKGFIILNQKPLIIASEPIMTSMYKGPIRGSLIMGRYLNSSDIKNLEIYLLDNPKIPEEVMKNISEKKSVTLKVLNENTIGGYIAMNDIHKKPIFILKTEMERDIYIHGQKNMIYFLLYFIITGLIISIITLALLNQAVISRLIKLGTTVNNITETGKLNQRIFVKGNDELTLLEKSINEMLSAMEESQEEFNKSVMNSINSQIAVLDKNGIIISVNEAWEKFSREKNPEKPRSSDLGKNYMIIWKSRTEEFSPVRNNIRNGIGDVVRGEKQQFSCEYEYELPDRKIWFLLNANPLLSKDGGTVISLTDITERKKYEEDLLMLEKRLRQTHKLEAIGTLAGGIAHDFNNILTGIMGYTEICIFFHTRDNPELKEDLERILKASKRARELIKQILTFSHQGEQIKQTFEIAPIIKECIRLLSATLPSTIEIIQNIEDENFPMIHGDSTQIHQVLINLCTNASYAMKEKGGRIEIKLKEIEIHEDRTRDGLNPGTYINLVVKDTGHGIAPEKLDKIFDPFFTDKPQGDGSGLGLSVVHGIVKSHGGTIFVHSVPGDGTEFSIFIPSEKKEIIREIIDEPSLISSGHGNILFIDDEEEIVDFARDILTHAGYEITATKSSKEAFDIFRLAPEKFDLVITDYTMPYMTGMELAKEFTKTRPDIPIILCTGYNDTIRLEDVNTMGIKEIIFKPVSVFNLAKTIEKVMENEKYKITNKDTGKSS